jgi:hypothetical protein
MQPCDASATNLLKRSLIKSEVKAGKTVLFRQPKKAEK